MLYSFDNEERLVANGENSPPSTTNLEWIQGGFVHAQYSIETKYVSDPKYALFAKYIPNARTYLCPSDPPNITLDEYSYARVRSYELNCYVGWEGDWDFRLPGDFKVFRKQQQISPTPSEIFLFQDVNPKSICWPHFGVRMDESSFFNFPSSAHSRGGIISYCDGHVAYHRWEDQRTVTAFAGSYHAHHQPSPGNPDLAWLRNHTTVPKQ